MNENFEKSVTLESIRGRESALASRPGKAGALGGALLGISMALAPMDAEAQAPQRYESRAQVDREISNALNTFCATADEYVGAQQKEFVLEDPTGFTIVVRQTEDGSHTVSVAFAEIIGKKGTEFYGIRKKINCDVTEE